MSDTQAIKDRLNIEDLIGEYVKLKPAGVNLKGLCPFHGEKTPSFMVNRERQTFKCFGCSKGGDVFTFVQEIEGMEFVEALKLLADKAGVTLTKQASQTNSNQKNRIKDINLQAARFYHNFLNQIDSAKEAKQYLFDRGLTQETIDDWQIGFIPDQWELLTKYLLKKGHGIEDLVAAGITIKRDKANTQTGKGFYDRFRGRIMFPIRNVHGAVVGFTGRVLKETEYSGGKYVNTPQTLVYDKSRVVFGLDKARQSIRTSKIIVMTEGQMDVIACHQAGMKNVVATSGTALTEQQIKLLKRYAPQLKMAFDADDAGQKAAKRGIDIAIASGLHVKVIQIPEGQGNDPDECIKQDKNNWYNAVKNSVDIMNWYLDKAFKNRDIGNPHDKQAVADEVLPEISRLPYAVEKDHWLQELGRRLSVDVSVLIEDMTRVQNSETQRKAPTKTVEQKTEEVIKKDKLSALLEKWFGFGLRFDVVFKEEFAKVKENIMFNTEYAPLYEQIKNQYTAFDKLNHRELRDSVQKVGNPENIVDVLLMKSEWEFSSINEGQAQREMQNFTQQIIKEWTKQRRIHLGNEIKKAEEQNNKVKLEELLKQFQEL